MSMAFWSCCVVTGISSAVSFGYATAGVRAAERSTQAPSLYALMRSLALLIICVVAAVVGSEDFLAACALAMILVQALDTVVGLRIRDVVKTVGPAATALANAAVLVWMLLT